MTRFPTKVLDAILPTDPVLKAGYVAQSPKGWQQFVTTPNAALRGFHTALANRVNAACDVVVLGHSIVEGQGATSTAQRYSGRFRDRLREAFPTPGVAGGEGFLASSIAAVGTISSPFVTTTGSPAIGSYGPNRRMASLTSAAHGITWAAQQMTSCKVMYRQTNGSATITVDGAGSQTLTVPAGGTDGQLYPVTGVTSGAHAIAAAWASGTAGIDGIVVYNGDETAGVRVHSAGFFGSTTADWGVPSSSGGATGNASFGWPAAVAALTPKLVVIHLGENDGLTAKNIPSAATATNLQQVITYLNAAVTPKPSIVLVAGYQRSDTLIEPWSNYVAAIYAAAAGQSNVAVCDLSMRFPAVGSSGDIYSGYYDTVHPRPSYHALIAEYLLDFVRPH